jgi:hypothetical protein
MTLFRGINHTAKNGGSFRMMKDEILTHYLESI